MKLGLVCISEQLKEQDKTLGFRTITRQGFQKLPWPEARSKLGDICLHNITVAKKIIEHCHDVGISHYRLSSDILPRLADPMLKVSLDELPNALAIRCQLSVLGRLARMKGVTLSAHPGQFNVLASKNWTTVKNTILSLNHEALVMDLIGLPRDYSAPMCLHLNLGCKGEPDDLWRHYHNRFWTAFDMCDEGVRSRLVLENEDKGTWNCERLYDCFGKEIPLVYDTLHDSCNTSEHRSQSWPQLFADTWGTHTPVFHWSEGIEKTGKHADFATTIPWQVKLFPNVTWEVELKAKDKAIVHILENKDVLGVNMW